jgi:hypothetical protein
MGPGFRGESRLAGDPGGARPGGPAAAPDAAAKGRLRRITAAGAFAWLAQITRCRAGKKSRRDGPLALTVPPCQTSLMAASGSNLTTRQTNGLSAIPQPLWRAARHHAH